jgi:FkbM family methyltransferase
MVITTMKAVLRRVRKALERRPDRFLKDVSGVVHVGANIGQERELYDAHGVSVLWVEPIPEVFAQLNANISGFKNQRAVQALVTDVDDKEYEFHIANNSGASSSILDFKQHKDIWPGVAYTTSVRLRSTTLTRLLEREQVDRRQYNALIMDTQGSELLVLRGGVPVLDSFEFIKTEVPDFESYEGCCQLADISAFMTQHGYKEVSRHKFATRAQGGSYFDIVYRRQG